MGLKRDRKFVICWVWVRMNKCIPQKMEDWAHNVYVLLFFHVFCLHDMYITLLISISRNYLPMVCYLKKYWNVHQRYPVYARDSQEFSWGTMPHQYLSLHWTQKYISVEWVEILFNLIKYFNWGAQLIGIT